METINKLEQISTNTLETIFNAALRKRDHVMQYGQRIKNPNLDNFNDPTLIDTLDLLKYLSDNAYDTFDITGYNMYDNKVYDILETNFLDIQEKNHINTYNWSSPLSNDLDFKVYDSDCGFTILEVNVHNFGDPRGNYGLGFIFTFDKVEDWFYIFEDFYCEGFEIDGIAFDYNWYSECGVFNVYDTIKDTDVDYDVYIGDYDDCKKYVEDYKNNNL